MKTKILVMDDYIDTRLYLEMILTDHGFAVCLMKSGEECLEKVIDEAPDLLLLDINMPGINGYETRRARKSFMEGI